MCVEAVAHDAAEQLAVHAERSTPPQHRAGRLALERRRVDRALAGHDERRAGDELVEANEVEDELRALDELRAHGGERRPESAAGPGAGPVAIRGELLEGG